jgi:hypothetical protein
MGAFEDTVKMMGRLNVTDYTAPQDTQQDETRLRKQGLQLVHVARQMVENAESFMRDLDIGESLDEKMILLDALDADTSNLADIVVSMHHTIEDLVTAHISSLGKPNSEVQKLLSYFMPQLRAIVGGVLSRTGDDKPKLLSVLEECYKHAYEDSGTLCCNAYFDVFEKEALQSPHESDYESEQYYEYENRSQLDEEYAADIEGECIRRDTERLEERKHTKRTWIDFWSQALQKCPSGPTLFVPTIIHDIDDLPPAPRYLFRAFDSDSSGLSNDTVVASAASISDIGLNQDNIFSLPPARVSLKLWHHLNNHGFFLSNPDNLMSWSNSLLFVIQYAIWRSERRGWCPSEVHICAIDTSRFPKGQFARDMWLIEKCHNDFWRENPLESLIQLRKRRGYYHGEHLSQGTVNHKGRSCVFSLQDLINAGLCELYPELDDLEGRKRWTNRVIALRSMWAARSSTTQEDVRLAMQLAESCFHGMATLDIALMFLTFRNREVVQGREEFRNGKFGLTNLWS